MTILPSHIKYYKATRNTDLNSNGGVISDTEITSGVLNNVFPNVTNTERTTGKIRYRKFFIKNENASDLTLLDAKVFVSSQSSGGDCFQILKGAATNVQSDISG